MEQTLSLGCLVMAAGSGRRFGGNKLAAELDGKTLIRRALEAVPGARFSAVTVQQWEKSIKDVTDALQGNLKRFNPIFMMADSGARGSMNQIRQLAGMRGLMADTNGRTIEIPIKANFREGLSALEYFISSRGARKGLTDTALRTADSGYLTRRMVDVCQDVIIREFDCGSTNGSWKGDYYEKGQLIDSFANRIRGRYPVYDIVDEKTGELLHSKDVMLREEDAKRLSEHGINKVYVRSVLGCKARSGVCAKCYGKIFIDATGHGTVGVMAGAESRIGSESKHDRIFTTPGICSAADVSTDLTKPCAIVECFTRTISASLGARSS